MSIRKKGRDIKKSKYLSKVKTPSIPFRRKTPLKSVSKAKKNAQLLEDDFKYSKNREEKVKIKRKVILAANRADKKGKKRGISKIKKDEYKQIARIYRNTYQRMVLEDIWQKTEIPAIHTDDFR